jgi:hypothetical protein
MKSFLTLLLTLNSIVVYQTVGYKVKKIVGLFVNKNPPDGSEYLAVAPKNRGFESRQLCFLI